MTRPTVYESIAQALSARDMTTAELATITGFTTLQIHNSIGSGRRNGKTPGIYIAGYIRNGSLRQTVYSLTRQAEQAQDRPSSKKIPPRYMPPFRELTPEDHDMYAGRNLAMLTR